MLTYQFCHSTHVDAIVAAGPAYCHSLHHFECGDTDSGNGACLTDVSIIQLAEACPNLIHVSLEAATSLTDSSLLALVTKCPHLQYLQISGNDKIYGGVKGSALEAIGEDASLGTKLQKLRLTDQRTYGKEFSKGLKDLSAKRKKLAIEVGDTSERGGCVNTWLGGKMKMGYQALGGPGGFSQCGGYQRGGSQHRHAGGSGFLLHGFAAPSVDTLASSGIKRAAIPLSRRVSEQLHFSSRFCYSENRN